MIASGTSRGMAGRVRRREGGRREARSYAAAVAAGRARQTPALASSNLSRRRVHARPHTPHSYQRLARRATEQLADDARPKFTLASRRLNPLACKSASPSTIVRISCRGALLRTSASKAGELNVAAASRHFTTFTRRPTAVCCPPPSQLLATARHSGLSILQSKCLTNCCVLWPLCLPMRRLNADESAVAGQMSSMAARMGAIKHLSRGQSFDVRMRLAFSFSRALRGRPRPLVSTLSLSRR